MSLEKYRELYELSKEVFAEELARSERIDNKASKYLTALTFLLGVFVTFNKQILQSTIPPINILEWIIIIVDILLIVIVVCAWFVIFSVFKIHQYAKIPIDIDFFDNNILIDIYYAMAKGMKENNEKNKEVGDKKSKRLYYGYSLIKFTVILLFVFSMLLTANTWIKYQSSKKEEIKMTQSEDQNGNVQNTDQQNGPQNTSSDKPNPNVKPPNFQLVTEGYDPSKVIQRTPRSQKSDKNDK